MAGLTPSLCGVEGDRQTTLGEDGARVNEYTHRSTDGAWSQ